MKKKKKPQPLDPVELYCFWCRRELGIALLGGKAKCNLGKAPSGLYRVVRNTDPCQGCQVWHAHGESCIFFLEERSNGQLSGRIIHASNALLQKLPDYLFGIDTKTNTRVFPISAPAFVKLMHYVQGHN